jgi:hypothetical protein
VKRENRVKRKIEREGWKGGRMGEANHPFQPSILPFHPLEYQAICPIFFPPSLPSLFADLLICKFLTFSSIYIRISVILIGNTSPSECWGKMSREFFTNFDTLNRSRARCWIAMGRLVFHK